MATKKKATRTRKKKLTPEQEWEALKEKIGEDDVSTYQMVNNYPIDTAIDHPKFGLGFVIQAFPNKIEVTFKVGPRVLIQNRK